LSRLLGVSTKQIVEERFTIGANFSTESGAAVLLKGAPTVVFCPGGDRFVSAAGTAALATGGSGDVLTGISGTLLAQLAARGTKTWLPAGEVAALAAFIHGRAAELCGPVRGTTLDDILLALSDAWNEGPADLPDHLLTCVPAVP
jgi:NAD(P)H-hydrate epimerase